MNLETAIFFHAYKNSRTGKLSGICSDWSLAITVIDVTLAGGIGIVSLQKIEIVIVVSISNDYLRVLATRPTQCEVTLGAF